MKFRIWKNSIEDARLQNILCSFGGEVMDGSKYESGADVDVIFGSWKDRDVPHHNLKRQIVKNSKNLIVLETPLLGREKVGEIPTDNWFRVGLNGFMRNAQYPEVDNDRFQKVLSETGEGADLRVETNKNGEYILVVLQLPGDASLDGTDINDWCVKTVEQIRKITDRDIVVRFPQLPREFADFGEIFKTTKGTYYQHGTHDDKEITLANAYAVITFSSGMGVEAILRGRRTYVGSENGFWSRNTALSDVLEKDYENHVQTSEFDKWLSLIVSTQWNTDEISKGECREAFEKLIGENA